MFNMRLILSISGLLVLILTVLIAGLLVINPLQNTSFVVAYRDSRGFDYDYFVEDTVRGYRINLTNHGNVAHDVEVDWFEGRQQIAYAVQDGAHFQINMQDLSSGTLSIIREGRAPKHSLQVSPDGAYIAFLERVQARDEIKVYTMSSAQTVEYPSVFDDFHGVVRGYAWSPDSTRLAVDIGGFIAIHYVDGSPSQLIRPNENETDRLGRISTIGCLPMLSFDWMPDNQTIIGTGGRNIITFDVVNSTVSTRQDARINQVISGWDADTRRNPNDDAPCLDAINLSPDGRWLTFNLWRYGVPSRPLVIVNLESAAEPIVLGSSDERFILHDWIDATTAFGVIYNSLDGNDNICQFVTLDVTIGAAKPIDYACDSESAERYHLAG